MQMKCLFRSFDTSVRLIWVLSFPHVYSSTVLLLLNLPLLAWLMTTEACALVFWPPSESNSLIPFYKHDKSPLNERWKIPPVFLFIISRGESRKTFFFKSIFTPDAVFSQNNGQLVFCSTPEESEKQLKGYHSKVSFKSRRETGKTRVMIIIYLLRHPLSFAVYLYNTVNQKSSWTSVNV